MPYTLFIQIDVTLACDHPGCPSTRVSGRPLATVQELHDFLRADEWAVVGDPLLGAPRVCCPLHASFHRHDAALATIQDFADRRLERFPTPTQEDPTNEA